MALPNEPILLIDLLKFINGSGQPFFWPGPASIVIFPCIPFCHST